MAVDKLVDSTQLDSDLTSVANAIRAKSGTSAQLAFPSGFVSAVEAIPSGGGSISDKNLLKNAQFSAGYINNSGGISGAGAQTKEVVSDEIDISAVSGAIGSLCTFANSTNEFTTTNHWATVGWYDETHTFISRAAASNNPINKYTPPANAKYIRYTCRTYGHVAVYVCAADDMFELVTESAPVEITVS